MERGFWAVSPASAKVLRQDHDGGDGGTVKGLGRVGGRWRRVTYAESRGD